MTAASEYSWNVFRYLGDYLHLVSMLVVLFVLFKNRNCRGLSFKTQLFYFLIFLTRYTDLLASHTTTHHATYLLVFKLFYIVSSAVIVFVMRKWSATIETNKDTCSFTFVIVPCVVSAMVAILWTNQHKTLTLYLWMFSEFLEAFAMLPQYIFTYRQDAENKRSDKGIFLFICLVGSYRVLYAANWIYKKINLGSAYSDTVSWIGGIIEILLFFDFLFNRGFLRIVVLSVDSKVNEIAEKIIEMPVLQRRMERQVDSPSFDQEVRKRRNPNYLQESDDVDEAMLII